MLLRPGHLSLDELQAIHAGGQPLLIDPAALPAIQASAAVVQAAAAGDAPVYGVNTGFGKLAGTRISADDLATLQRNLIRSHSVGVGEPLAAPIMRLMMATKAASLARGYSGCREVVVDTILAVHNAGLVPCVPSQGSVGASGDLAPLAHMSLVLLGEGKARYKGEWMQAAEALKVAGLTPLTLAAKEGLALLNGTQVSTAFALRGLFEGEDLFAGALALGGLTVEAVLGSRSPFDARIHAARGQRGQIDSAAAYRDLLGESKLTQNLQVNLGVTAFF